MAATGSDRDLEGRAAIVAPPVPWWRQPLRWSFHLVLAVPLAVLLWSAGLPGGGNLLDDLVALLALFVLGVIWSVRMVLVLAITPRSGGFVRWLVVAPVAVLAVFGLILADVPLHARWVQSRSAFEAVVDDEPGDLDAAGPGGWVQVPGFPRRLGTYEITSATRSGEAVAFSEQNGAFLDQAGFVYLPGGPDATDGHWPNGLLIGLDPLGGGWYMFTVHS